VTSGSLPPGLTLDTSGAITGTPTAAGTYTFDVTASSSVSGIPSTAQRTLTITIAAAPVTPLVAADDDFSAAPVPATGGTAGDVLANDTLGGAPVTAADVVLTLTDDAGLTGAALAADGTLTIPASAAAGAYTLAYRLCEAADPQNCATASVRVAVQTAVVTPPTPGDPGGGDQGGGDQGERDPAPVTLASTGADIALPILFAATLLIAGAAVMSLRRRDRPTAG
jgi:hypothetical protein